MKLIEVKPTCGLCGGEHTANYRGCPVYLRIERTPAQSSQPKTTTPSNWKPLPIAAGYDAVQGSQSFPNVVKDGNS